MRQNVPHALGERFPLALGLGDLRLASRAAAQRYAKPPSARELVVQLTDELHHSHRLGEERFLCRVDAVARWRGRGSANHHHRIRCPVAARRGRGADDQYPESLHQVLPLSPYGASRGSSAALAPTRTIVREHAPE
jgi:hypothetical protein